MEMNLFLLLFTSTLISLCLSYDLHMYAFPWSYWGFYGPSIWKLVFPKCNGSTQSPIDIKTSSATPDPTLGTFYRGLFYSPPSAMELKNNGHSLQMNIISGAYTIDNKGLLPFPAKLAQYHLHWAESSYEKGSEHTMNGVRYYGELHLVHYNTKYGDLGTAASEPDGLAVLAFFLEADYPQDNADFNQIFDLLNGGELKNKGDEVEVKSMFSVETLLPYDLSKFYRYSGSLTTPPCYESVVWTVFEKPIKISQKQAKFLSESLRDGYHVIGDNFRPIQLLNGRIVTTPGF